MDYILRENQYEIAKNVGLDYYVTGNLSPIIAKCKNFMNLA